MFDDLLSKFTGGDDNSSTVDDAIQSVVPDMPEMPELPEVPDVTQHIPGIGQNDEE